MLITTNRKGGAGKTSVAVNLAACVARSRRVLLLDCDAQGDASAWLGVHDTGEATADALSGRASLERAIRETESGVDLVPGGEALGAIAGTIAPDAVGRALRTIRRRTYDCILADCPPGLSRLVLAVWRADLAAIALVPVDGIPALRAVTRLRHAWDDAGLALDRMRIVLSRHRSRQRLDQAVEVQARTQYGDAVLRSRIRPSVAVGESAARRQPLILDAPEHRVTADFLALAEEVVHG